MRLRLCAPCPYSLLQPERLLSLAKYRFQTEARSVMYNLVQLKPYSILSIQRHHAELLKSNLKVCNGECGVSSIPCVFMCLTGSACQSICVSG